MSRTTKAPARKRRFPKYDEGFLVDYGCPRAKAGARRGRLTPNLAREYMRTHDAIQEVLAEGFASAEQEALEEEYFQAKVERWARERVEDEVDQAWIMRHDDDYRYGWYGDRFVDWAAEEAYFDALEAEQDRAFEVMHLARAIVRTQLTRIEG